MVPFLASSIRVVKSDGSSTTINSDEAEHAADADTTANKSITSAPSKHSRHSDSSDDIPAVVVPIVAIVFVFLWLIIKTLMAPFTQRNAKSGKYVPVAPIPQGGFSDEEVALLHKLTQTLAQMERRVESLETILIDQTRTKEKYGTKL